jgi:hypothetical protein
VRDALVSAGDNLLNSRQILPVVTDWLLTQIKPRQLHQGASFLELLAAWSSDKR